MNISINGVVLCAQFYMQVLKLVMRRFFSLIKNIRFVSRCRNSK